MSEEYLLNSDNKRYTVHPIKEKEITLIGIIGCGAVIQLHMMLFHGYINYDFPESYWLLRLLYYHYPSSVTSR